MKVPPKFDPIRERALCAMQPIRAADDNCYFYGERTVAGQRLPPYYLIYFLFVELLEFPHFGRSEKVAWSVPIDFEGKNYVIEHRKLGLGLFSCDAQVDEQEAEKIVVLIKKGVGEASPFFEWLAEQAVQNSALNVANKNASLFERFEYLKTLYKQASEEAIRRADECVVEKKQVEGGTAETFRFPALEIRTHAEWLALSAIDAFFSWTEHVLIHLAILQGKITTGMEVAKLAMAIGKRSSSGRWTSVTPTTKGLFDDRVLIRCQLRNYMAHGAFGKRREAFTFHSRAGAVPVLLPHQVGRRRFALSGASGFDEAAALDVIDRFVEHLWSHEREPARAYIQESSLPIILPMASDGTYENAMRSVDDMQALIASMENQFDQAANMDW